MNARCSPEAIDREDVTLEKVDGKCGPHMYMRLRFMHIYGMCTPLQDISIKLGMALVKPVESQLRKYKNVLKRFFHNLRH